MLGLSVGTISGRVGACHVLGDVGSVSGGRHELRYCVIDIHPVGGAGAVLLAVFAKSLYDSTLAEENCSGGGAKGESKG